MMNRDGATAPPQPTTVEETLALMRGGSKEVFEIKCGLKVFSVRVLTLDETNEIRRFSIAEAERIGGDKVDRNVEMQKATLKMASTLTSGGIPGIHDKLLQALSVDQVNFLFEEYVAVIDSVNPSLQSIPPEEFQALVDALKKNRITSKDCSLKQLRAICTAFQGMISEPGPA